MVHTGLHGEYIRNRNKVSRREGGPRENTATVRGLRGLLPEHYYSIEIRHIIIKYMKAEHSDVLRNSRNGKGSSRRLERALRVQMN